MNGTGIHQFQLEGADGSAHDYIVTEHPAGEGMEIMYALLGLGAPTVLGLAGAALKSEDMFKAILTAIGGDELERGPDETGALVRLVADLDLERVGHELGRALSTGQAPGLTRKVLARVMRDGKSLGREEQFDIAYKANYVELLKAVWKVCTINRFFPALPTSQSSPPVMKLGARSSAPVA